MDYVFFCCLLLVVGWRLAVGRIAYRLERFLRVLKVLRVLKCAKHQNSTISTAHFRYTNIVHFPLSMPLLVLRTKGGAFLEHSEVVWF